MYSNKGLHFQIPVVFHRVLKLCVFVYRKTAIQTWLRSGLWTALFKKIFQIYRNFSLCILAASSIKLIQGIHSLNFWKLRQDPLLNQIWPLRHNAYKLPRTLICVDRQRIFPTPAATELPTRQAFHGAISTAIFLLYPWRKAPLPVPCLRVLNAPLISTNNFSPINASIELNLQVLCPSPVLAIHISL